jgi:hypothetical protein
MGENREKGENRTSVKTGSRLETALKQVKTGLQGHTGWSAG